MKLAHLPLVKIAVVLAVETVTAVHVVSATVAAAVTVTDWLGTSESEVTATV